MDKSRKIKVAIDLSPLRIGGENGGAKILVTTLLKEFSRLETDKFEYLLISESWNHKELMGLQSSNVTCIAKSTIFGNNFFQFSWKDRIKKILSYSSIPLVHGDAHSQQKADIVLESQDEIDGHLLKRTESKLRRIKVHLERTLVRRRERLIDSLGIRVPKALLSAYPLKIFRRPAILREKYGIDLLFCPFSDPDLAEDGLPLVAIAYDLQHLDLPFFFTEDERRHRTRFLRSLLLKADKVVCISQFTQQSLLNHFEPESDQLLSIPICIHERLKPHSLDVVEDYLNQFGLNTKPYFLFPANFWPHKNHRMLLLAYSIYRKVYPGNALNLVLTGALDYPKRELKDIARRLDCDASVHFLGFLSEEDLTAVWQGCSGLIFPSLYEGFGIPLLEAMWFGKPVACSSVGSLPEVAGGAVIYFDPRQPEAIAQAMIRLGHDDDLIGQLKVQSQQQLRLFSQRHMAEEYLAIFKAAVLAH